MKNLKCLLAAVLCVTMLTGLSCCIVSAAELPERPDSPAWAAKLGDEKKAEQLFVVAGFSQTTAYVSMHEKDASGNWKEIMTTPGYIGKFGLGKTKEGDGMTPVGEFHFNYAFGIADDPGCAIKYQKVTEDDYWSGDGRDGYHYNEMVSLKDYPDLAVDDSERIMDYEYQYQYCLNISYNEEGVPGVGSAIFLHCLGPIKPYTGGCVAIPKAYMETVMKNVREDCVVVIDSMETLAPEDWEEMGLAGTRGFGTQKEGDGPKATNEFVFDGKTVAVTVDLTDGWTVEYGENATYVYDGNTHGDDEAIAYGVYHSKEDYEETVREYSSYDSYEEVENGIRFRESDGLSKYVMDLGNDVYYMIMASEPDQAEEIYARFDVKIVE